jgi:hypothetical protein
VRAWTIVRPARTNWRNFISRGMRFDKVVMISSREYSMSLLSKTMRWCNSRANSAFIRNCVFWIPLDRKPQDKRAIFVVAIMNTIQPFDPSYKTNFVQFENSHNRVRVTIISFEQDRCP